jgi:hypothetical protein
MSNIVELKVIAIFVLGMVIGIANFVFGMYYGRKEK